MDTEFWTHRLRHVFDSYELCFSRSGPRRSRLPMGIFFPRK